MVFKYFRTDKLVFYVVALISVQLTYSDETPLQGDCETLLKRFANHTGDFVRCAVSNIRPIRMCTSCVQEYTDVLVDHDVILHVNDANETCKDMYINIDRVEIVEEALNYVTGLWKKSNCDNCLTKDKEGGLHVTNLTTAFLDAYDETEGCFDLNSIQTVCVNCSGVYQKLNSFYQSIKSEFGDGQLCMDVVDSMNRTQNEWNTELNCRNSLPPVEKALLASCTCALTLPILFYIVLWRWSRTPPAPVSVQKRLGERFVEMLRSRGSFLGQMRQSAEQRGLIVEDDGEYAGT